MNTQLEIASMTPPSYPTDHDPQWTYFAPMSEFERKNTIASPEAIDYLITHKNELKARCKFFDLFNAPDYLLWHPGKSDNCKFEPCATRIRNAKFRSSE